VFAALYEAEDVSEGRQVDGRCSYGAAVFKVVRFCSWFQHHTSLVFLLVVFGAIVAVLFTAFVVLHMME